MVRTYETALVEYKRKLERSNRAWMKREQGLRARLTRAEREVATAGDAKVDALAAAMKAEQLEDREASLALALAAQCVWFVPPGRVQDEARPNSRSPPPAGKNSSSTR